MNKELIKHLPLSPGVYLMKDRNGKILYIGKAKNIRSRVLQYFSKADTRAHIPYLLQHVDKIETIIVASEKEALLLENTLIKKHQPKYNLLLKDDKTFIAVKLTKDLWPKLELVRLKHPPQDKAHYYGPYTSGYAAKKTVDLLNKLFHLRQCSNEEFARRTRPCILYEIGRCVAPCVGLCTKDEYNVRVEKVHLFLKGQDKDIVKQLEKEMQNFSNNLEFEKAAATLQMIRQIKQTLESQYVDIPKGGSFSIFALASADSHVTVALFQIKNGKVEGVSRHSFMSIAEDAEDALSSFILQYYQRSSSVPGELLSNISFSNKKEMEEVLSELAGHKVTIAVPHQGKKHALLQMALDNACQYLKEDIQQAGAKADLLFLLKDKCCLQNFPKRIECFDTSHLSGENPVASMVVFEGGVKAPHAYRKYHLKTAKKADDYSGLEEVLTRRFSKTDDEKMPLPDLVIIDGGKGQLSIAKKALQKLAVAVVDIIAVTKEEGRHDKGLTSEKVYLAEKKDPLLFSSHTPLLHLLQRIRDEAHRFAITFQRRTMQKTLIRSQLEEISGIGPKKRIALLKHFGSIEKIRTASREELEECPGIQKKDIEQIKRFFA